MADPKRQAEEKLENMSPDKKQEILESFDEFQNYLNDKIQKGEKLGLSEEHLAKGAERVAEYLKNHEEPKNSEEKLLQEMWKVSDDDEKHKMAHTLVKLAKKEGN
ncbi:DUF3243 domain-containing protein [Salipaludibacillus aurantiacus]|uniref:DUF3243 domain-containing protein n=1 Tax=Salipaludibacillus aurantiacus TaxID=1601833 RepID=A0A1H9WBZ5_9BACI|nr:DUF3243 domain-containing protein [Salipaludibacillus aurantiacus]SES31472.1 Protein of unknown function [Salipaludibacillus aurantiacus]